MRLINATVLVSTQSGGSHSFCYVLIIKFTFLFKIYFKFFYQTRVKDLSYMFDILGCCMLEIL